MAEKPCLLLFRLLIIAALGMRFRNGFSPYYFKFYQKIFL